VRGAVLSYREPPVYIDNLLVIRGLCAVGVALAHFLGVSELSFRWYLENGWEAGATSYAIFSVLALTTGKNFVLFFFVHSGYLMGKIFFTDRYGVDRSGIVGFYCGRLLRIAPLLYLNLIVCLLILPSANPTIFEAWGDFLFVNNFTGRNINGVTWSLSWEMQYYLLAPFVFAIFAVPSKKALFQVVALACVFEIASLLGMRDIPPTEFLFYFLLGFAVNLALRHFQARKFAGSTVLAIVGGFFVANGVYYVLFNAGLERVAANPFIGIAAAFTIYLLELPRMDEGAPQPHERYGRLRLLTLRFWTWMGIISYGVYLWHLPIAQLGNSFTVRMALALIDSVGGVDVGWQRMLIFHAVQLPLLLGATLLVSLITFFTVEIRFRPHLYRWDRSRYGGGRMAAVAKPSP
jgi:peptidoglycan/LPS O-acetylase OafA/YrhL